MKKSAFFPFREIGGTKCILGMGVFFAAVLGSVSSSQAGSVVVLQNGVAPTGEYAAPGFTLRGEVHNADQILFAGRSGGGQVLRAVLQFDLAPLGSSKVTNVRLRLRSSNTSQPEDFDAAERVTVYQLTAGFNPDTVHFNERAPGVPWTPEEKSLGTKELTFALYSPKQISTTAFLDFPATPELLAAVESARAAKQPLALVIAAPKAETSAQRWVAGFFAPHAGETGEEKAARRPILEVTLE